MTQHKEIHSQMKHSVCKKCHLLKKYF